MNKKSALVLVAFLCIYFLSFSQNYRIIKPGQEFYYVESSSWNMRGMRVDSFSVSGMDTIFYHFYSIRDTSINFGPCDIIPNGASWLGSKTIVKPDGENIFFNNNNDSIRIKTLASLNENWIFYTFPDKSYLEATITSVDTATILSVLDSVKNIMLQAKDSLGNPISSTYNGEQIVVGKNLGLIKIYEVFDIYGNPFGTMPYTISNERKLKVGEIYDYEVGDEFHISIEVEPLNAPEPWYILKVIGKSFPDTSSVSYSIEKTTYSYAADWDTFPPIITTNISIDTISPVYTNINSYFFSVMPEETIKDSVGLTSYNLYASYYSTGRPCLSTTPDWVFYDPFDSCYSQGSWEQSTTNTFIKGCGSLYCYIDAGNMAEYCEFLNYYKKGSETWGNPLVITERKFNLSHLQLLVYPNPASTYLTITFTLPKQDNFEISILDIYGRKILNSSNQHGLIGENILTPDINLNTLPNGTYFVLMNYNGILASKKFSVIH